MDCAADRHHLPNAVGDWASQAITDTAIPLASSQAYSYDNADRLTTVQDTQAIQCTTRGYTYDADSNRTSLTSYTPNSDGTCQATSGTTTSWAYDSADRVTNSGYDYDTQGDITTTPSPTLAAAATSPPPTTPTTCSPARHRMAPR